MSEAARRNIPWSRVLKDDVLDQLAWDPQLDASSVVVWADDGKVTLTGSVPTHYEVTLAEDDAKLVGGVAGMDNQLLVGLLGDAVADGELAVAAHAALDARQVLPKGAVAVDVVEGWVTLSGEVRRHDQRLAAEHGRG